MLTILWVTVSHQALDNFFFFEWWIFILRSVWYFLSNWTSGFWVTMRHSMGVDHPACIYDWISFVKCTHFFAHCFMTVCYNWCNHSNITRAEGLWYQFGVELCWQYFIHYFFVLTTNLMKRPVLALLPELTCPNFVCGHSRSWMAATSPFVPIEEDKSL